MNIPATAPPTPSFRASEAQSRNPAPRSPGSIRRNPQPRRPPLSSLRRRPRRHSTTGPVIPRAVAESTQHAPHTAVIPRAVAESTDPTAPSFRVEPHNPDSPPPTQPGLFGGAADICTVEKDPTTSGLEAMADRKYARYCQRHAQMVKNVDEIGLPAPGQQFRIVTRRTFNAIQFLEYICRRETILDLKMAIYSINFHAAVLLSDMVTQGHIKQCEVLMSNLRNQAHREKEEIVKKLFTDHPRIDLFFCSSHAKMFSCQTERGNYYTCEGSGNLAYNSRVEQYVIDNDEGLYRFSCSWIGDIKRFLSGKRELETC